MRKLTRSQAATLAAKLVRESEGCPLCRRTWVEVQKDAELMA